MNEFSVSCASVDDHPGGGRSGREDALIFARFRLSRSFHFPFEDNPSCREIGCSADER
jgi:hypothetical protein